MNPTKQEFALINFVRTLCFDDLLDAYEGLTVKAGDASMMAKLKKEAGELHNAEAFSERSSRLEKLADLLGEANEDYRAGILDSVKNGQATSMFYALIHCFYEQAGRTETDDLDKILLSLIINYGTLLRRYSSCCFTSPTIRFEAVETTFSLLVSCPKCRAYSRLSSPRPVGFRREEIAV